MLIFVLARYISVVKQNKNTKWQTFKETDMSKRNEFNHKCDSVGGAIDELLCEGGTAKDIAEKASAALSTEEKPIKVNAGRVKSHVKHLREDPQHAGKIKISEEDDVYMIVGIESEETASE